jgi:hypothetical protein
MCNPSSFTNWHLPLIGPRIQLVGLDAQSNTIMVIMVMQWLQRHFVPLRHGLVREVYISWE